MCHRLIRQIVALLQHAVLLTLVVLLATQYATGQDSSKSDCWKDAETRLKDIYEHGDFRPKGFNPVWLSDSSGFVVNEMGSSGGQLSQWLYDANTGERRLVNTEKDALGKSDVENRSPGDNFRISSGQNQLRASDLTKDTETVLVSAEAGRDIEYRRWQISPDGSKVLFVEADFSDVRQRNMLLPTDPSYPAVRQQRFARVGEAIEKLRVGVVGMDGSDLKWLPMECPDEGIYLGQVEWAGNSDEVLVERFSRFRDKRDFLLFNLRGEAKTIYSEVDDAWVESSQGKNSGLVWIKDGQEFVVISEKDGWRHAYRYSRDSKEIALLTPGDYDIIDRAVIDEQGGWYYFYASPKDGTQKHLYRVDLGGQGKLEQISPATEVGTHHYHFAPDFSRAVHTFSSLNSPPKHELIDVNFHQVIAVLEDNSELVKKIEGIRCQPVEFVTVEIGEGISCDAWVLKPQEFNSQKKYPVLVYVYGEPHLQTVLNEWGAAQIDFHRVVAELGYVVISIDNRGTPAPKGAAWRRSIFGSLGPLSTEEQEAALKAIAAKLAYIDLDRVGIWGWSGGGSNTLNALFRKPNTYHVGIAVVPKPQPHLYNAWFQEIYMRDRDVNPEGYERSAPINFAEGLQGKLLIMTGSGETNTHIQIIEGLVDKLIALGKPFDYMVYPNRDHGLREGDGTVVHVRMHILRFLLDNLPGGARER